MREYLEHYGQVSVSLERMSDYTKKLLERAKAAEAESKENYYTMIEFRKAADMNCDRYLKLKCLLEEIKATHDKTDWAGCESVKYLQSCAYSEIITKIQAALEERA